LRRSAKPTPPLKRSEELRIYREDREHTEQYRSQTPPKNLNKQH
jgi:hypothetical protein